VGKRRCLEAPFAKIVQDCGSAFVIGESPCLRFYTNCVYMLMFEWDEAKRRTNIEARSLDFLDALVAFDGRAMITTPSTYPLEVRFVSTAILDDRKFYTVVWTWRGEAQRIISFRRARRGEERAYRQIHN
jgi:uncharacterized DUF497 family protein